jgi:peptidoglycan/xylan/chitin deacetylase (PgdA/CDA1 family)/GT2 family glycosyltransferase
MSDSDPVALSVLVASRDRRELLRRLLDSLRGQQDPGPFEVIVADDGSRDGTAEMVEATESSFPLRVLRLDGAGKATALNRALSEARGQHCLFLDDDLVADPGLIAAHLAIHREEGRTLAIGRLIQAPPRRRDPYAAANARAWNERYEDLADGVADWADCYGANFSAPLEALLEVGGFATDLPAVEDLEIAFRLTRSGCAPRYLPRAEALHDDGKPGRAALADQERFGAVATRLSERHPAMRARLLGWFTDSTPRETVLRLILLRLRAPSAALARAGRLVPMPGPRRIWFGFVSRYAFWRGVRGAMERGQWIATVRGVPVLMYHAFTGEREGSRFVLPGRRFAAQMRILRVLRYRVVRLEQLAAALADGTSLPRRCAVITIDDGYRDNLEIALPALRRRGYEGTVFLVSGRIGAVNDWDAAGAVGGRPLMAVEEIRRMAEGGVAAGAHGRTHASLPDLDDDAVRAEVVGSRRDLETATGQAVTAFAYPYGRHDARAVAASREAGYTVACTAFGRAARPGDDPFQIPRIEVRGTDSGRSFLRKLWFGDTA